AKLANERSILLAIDNTFTTPRAFQPYTHGADIVIHSVTKLLAGHSDVTLGYVSARTPALMERMYDASVTWGMTPSPFDCWLAERGLHTFELRYDRAEENAARLATLLAEQPGVEAVIYPGRADHPDGDLSTRILGNRTANMVSFRLRDDRGVANRFIRAAASLPFAPTLGDVATTISHPPSSSHRRLSPNERAALGITEGFFRVSVGVEHFDVIGPEFADAIAAATNATTA
ncbi:MAG: PLP-dependent transferase, partial [Pseudomonadota bacterium]